MHEICTFRVSVPQPRLCPLAIQEPSGMSKQWLRPAPLQGAGLSHLSDILSAATEVGRGSGLCARQP